MGIQADGGSPATPLKTLIVSQDRVASVLAGRLLERLGHARPERVETLAEAQAKAGAFEVLLVDADLWAAGGREWPVEGRPLVIAMSASAGDVGADAHLLKPLSLEALEQALKAGSTADPWEELLRMFGRDGVARMVTMLERDLPQLEVVLSESLDGQDRSGLRRQAHTMRGVAQQLGALTLADQCTVTEAAGRDAPWSEVVAGVRAMLTQYKALVRQLRERLDGG